MNLKRIIVAAVLVAIIPPLFGFTLTILSGAAGAEGSDWLHQPRLWLIRFHLMLVFVWLGRTQQNRLVVHGAAAAGLGWILTQVISFVTFRFIDQFSTKVKNFPPIGEWSLDLSGLLYLLLVAAIGMACGYAFRTFAARNRPQKRPL